MSWLWQTVLRWTLGCTCLFQIWYPWCVCPEVGLLGHMEASFNFMATITIHSDFGDQGGKKKKSVTFSTFSPSICHEAMGLDVMILAFWMLRFFYFLFFVFECWVLIQVFHSPLLPSSGDSLVPLHFLPLEWYHLHIWGCWYFSWSCWFQLVIHPTWHFAWCTLHRS